MRVNSVACAVTVNVDGDGVEEGDAEAAAQIRRNMGRCTRGALYAGQMPWLDSRYFPHHLGVSAAMTKITQDLTKAARSGAS